MGRLSHSFNDAARLARLMRKTVSVAREAGDELMRFYRTLKNNPEGFAVDYKGDGSEVTAADQAASDLIVSRLQKLTPGISVISEENAGEPEDPALFWVVDPLDGTKEFLHQTDGFAVKIALMSDWEPILGVVRAPAFETSWFATHHTPAFKQEGTAQPHTIHARPPQKGALTTLFNQKHADPALYHKVSAALRQQHNINLPANPDIRPSLPRSLQVAEGRADINLIVGKDHTLKESGGFIWDTAPDKLIAAKAGVLMLALSRAVQQDGSDKTAELTLEKVKPLSYSEARKRSPAILVVERNLGISCFPELKGLA